VFHVEHISTTFTITYRGNPEDYRQQFDGKAAARPD
jgi:hypothetical protein